MEENNESIILIFSTWCIIIIFLIVVCWLYMHFVFYNTFNCMVSEPMINIPSIETDNKKWSRRNTCIYKLDDTTSNVLGNNNITMSNNANKTDVDILFPCGYRYIDSEIESLPNIHDKNRKPKRVFIINGAEEITAKNYLWKNILEHHGINKATEIAPMTYILKGPYKQNDLIRLKKDHYQGKMYIMKKNIQRQEGIQITDDINKIIENKDDYVVVQNLLQDSYLVNGRKINLRVYIVIICHKDATDVFMFNDGFMYYTKQKFIKGSKEYDNHITTGYVERDVYHKNPLTHTDFKKYLDMNEGEKYHPSNEPRKLYQHEMAIRNQGLKVSNVIFERIRKMLADVFIAFKGKICTNKTMSGNPNPIYDDYSVQIFGADIAINDQLQPQIIEINKGPDLSPKDERDGTVKKKMVNDVLEIIGIKRKSINNGFINVIEM